MVNIISQPSKMPLENEVWLTAGEKMSGLWGPKKSKSVFYGRFILKPRSLLNAQDK
jgi:hypothetical protein